MNPIKWLYKEIRASLAQSTLPLYNFTPRAREVFRIAQEEAQKLNHDAIRPEHLLYGLTTIGSGVAAVVLNRSGVDVEKLRTEIQKSCVPKVVTHQQKTALPCSCETKDLLRTAGEEQLSLCHRFLGTEHLLLGLMQQKDSAAAWILTSSLNLNLAQIRREVLKELDPNYEALGEGTSTSRDEKG